MRMAALIGAAIGLAGCAAMTPSEVDEQGDRFTSTHSTTAEATMHCIVAHLDANETLFLARIGQPETTRDRLLVISVLGQPPDTAAVVRISTASVGSIAHWRIHPRMFGDRTFLRLKGLC